MKKLIYFIIHKFIFFFNKNIKIYSGVNINFNTKLEGHNVIYKNSDIKNLELGFGSYIGPGCFLNNMKIGKYCSIGPRVKIIQGLHPSEHFVSSHPSFYSTKKQAGFTFVHENIFKEEVYTQNGYEAEIGNDVWIGSDVLIMAGVKIASGAIIGTGSIVTQDIEAYSIAKGVPAKSNKFRFSKDHISFLLKRKWWDFDFQNIKSNISLMSNIDLFYENLKARNDG